METSEKCVKSFGLQNNLVFYRYFEQFQLETSFKRTTLYDKSSDWFPYKVIIYALGDNI